MNLVLAVCGASGVLAAKILVRKSPWPVSLVVSPPGRDVYERECGPVQGLVDVAACSYGDDDLAAPISSGSVPTVGMVVLPCTTNTVARIAGGVADTLITRAAHCHLKERRKLVLCVRETPWTLIDIENARRVAAAGGIIMPLSPPFYMASRTAPEQVTAEMLLSAYVDHVLAVLGHPAAKNWETIR